MRTWARSLTSTLLSPGPKTSVFHWSERLPLRMERYSRRLSFPLHALPLFSPPLFSPPLSDSLYILPQYHLLSSPLFLFCLFFTTFFSLICLFFTLSMHEGYSAFPPMLSSPLLSSLLLSSPLSSSPLLCSPMPPSPLLSSPLLSAQLNDTLSLICLFFTTFFSLICLF